MTKQTITLSRFSTIVEAYGADPDQWPADERAAAEALLAQSDEARHCWLKAGHLDALLDAVPAPAPASQDLRLSLIDMARQGSPEEAPAAPASGGPETAQADLPAAPGFFGALRGVAAEIGGVRPAGAALAASLVLGVALSGMVMPTSPPSEDLDVLELALLSNTFEGY